MSIARQRGRRHAEAGQNTLLDLVEWTRIRSSRLGTNIVYCVALRDFAFEPALVSGQRGIQFRRRHAPALGEVLSPGLIPLGVDPLRLKVLGGYFHSSHPFAKND